ncbi:MAG TPA: hypothetical protein VFF48_01100 [Brevundimonas sp.]|nr:hypothetical protein [Brevundimonas sp.]
MKMLLIALMFGSATAAAAEPAPDPDPHPTDWCWFYPDHPSCQIDR